jgi:hypothetical protein
MIFIGTCMYDKLTTRFSGKERDAESGLDYFGARYFSSCKGDLQVLILC